MIHIHSYIQSLLLNLQSLYLVIYMFYQIGTLYNIYSALVIAEYAYTTRVNEKIDIYSFGVVLLELVTGREPNFGDEHTSLAEWAWKHYAEENTIDEILDGEIKKPGFLDEMKTVFTLGLICTSTLPSSRPSMKEVLQILQSCRPQDDFDRKMSGKNYDVAPLLGNDKYLASYKRNSRKIADESDDNLLFSV